MNLERQNRPLDQPAQWARNTLREEGLIRDDTPRGVWGFSDAGRQWLKAQTGGK